jgi:hypothetical protein
VSGRFYNNDNDNVDVQLQHPAANAAPAPG